MERPRYWNRNLTKFIHNFTGRYFYEWLSSITPLVTRKFNLNKNDLFLTFNYTSTLEDIYDIPGNQIYHIHGFIKNIIDRYEVDNFTIRSEIQFGTLNNNAQEVEDVLSKSYENDEFYNVSIKPGISQIIGFCKASTKDIKKNYSNLESFINKEIDEVIVMGHSLMGIDFDYYKDTILPKLLDVKWTFYYHGKKVKMK